MIVVSCKAVASSAATSMSIYCFRTLLGFWYEVFMLLC